MDFADASLVLLATRSGIREVLTADRRELSVYRVRGRIRFIDVLGDSDPDSTKRR
jgi:predicted nucleic acid-binding protein